MVHFHSSKFTMSITQLSSNSNACICSKKRTHDEGLSSSPKKVKHEVKQEPGRRDVMDIPLTKKHHKKLVWDKATDSMKKVSGVHRVNVFVGTSTSMISGLIDMDTIIPDIPRNFDILFENAKTNFRRMAKVTDIEKCTRRTLLEYVNFGYKRFVSNLDYCVISSMKFDFASNTLLLTWTNSSESE